MMTDMMVTETEEAAINSSFKAIKDKGPNDRSLPPSLIHRVLGLWLVDVMVMDVPGLLCELLETLSTTPVLQDRVNYATEHGFFRFVTYMTVSREYIVGGGGKSFSEKSKGFLAIAKSTKLEAGMMVVRYLRDEVLARSEDITEPSPFPSSMTSEIAALGVVLTSVCDLVEARVAEEETACQGGTLSPVVAGSDEVGTMAPPGVAVSDGPAEARDQKGKEDGDEEKEGGEGDETREKGRHERTRGEVEHKQQRQQEEEEEVEEEVATPGLGGGLPMLNAGGGISEERRETRFAQDFTLAAKSHTRGQEVGVQCEDGGEASQDKLSLILAQLGQLQRMVFDGFAKLEAQPAKLEAQQAKLGAQRDDLKTGQQKLEEDLVRLRASLPSSSPISEVTGDAPTAAATAEGMAVRPRKPTRQKTVLILGEP